ncbi:MULTISPECIES: hypothetical protein [Aminobacterium]|uniref:hypothetical protein n=1 Tax=Aminobacterium TaxID=81466 RepID=UPI00257E52D5|nr:hypothetical protein [Aminobacterium sp. UBA4834]
MSYGSNDYSDKVAEDFAGCLWPILLVFFLMALVGHVVVSVGDFVYRPFPTSFPLTTAWRGEMIARNALGVKVIFSSHGDFGFKEKSYRFPKVFAVNYNSVTKTLYLQCHSNQGTLDEIGGDVKKLLSKWGTFTFLIPRVEKMLFLCDGIEIVLQKKDIKSLRSSSPSKIIQALLINKRLHIVEDNKDKIAQMKKYVAHLGVPWPGISKSSKNIEIEGYKNYRGLNGGLFGGVVLVAIWNIVSYRQKNKKKKILDSILRETGLIESFHSKVLAETGNALCLKIPDSLVEEINKLKKSKSFIPRNEVSEIVNKLKELYEIQSSSYEVFKSLCENKEEIWAELNSYPEIPKYITKSFYDDVSKLLTAEKVGNIINRLNRKEINDFYQRINIFMEHFRFCIKEKTWQTMENEETDEEGKFKEALAFFGLTKETLTPQNVKTTFRQLAKRYHPDANKVNTENEMLVIQEYYSLLLHAMHAAK